MGVLHDLP
uniref:Uncharacterized protein n=1 Tax=Arundo donax TaxID=35708 RepID=A0A0A9BNX7_ARUDO